MLLLDDSDNITHKRVRKGKTEFTLIEGWRQRNNPRKLDTMTEVHDLMVKYP